MRHEGRSTGITDVDLEPMDQRHARSGRLHLGHGVEEAVGIDHAGNAVIAGVEQEARPLLLGGVAAALIDIAEGDGAGGAECIGGLVVGLQGDGDLTSAGEVARVVGLAVIAGCDGEDALGRRHDFACGHAQRAATIDATTRAGRIADDPVFRAGVTGHVDIILSCRDVDVRTVDCQRRAVRVGRLTTDRDGGIELREGPAVVRVGVLGNRNIHVGGGAVRRQILHHRDEALIDAVVDDALIEKAAGRRQR